MKAFKYLAVATIAGFCLTLGAPRVKSDVHLNVNIGAAPVCPYGYYPYPPYDCAPWGYYGPEWFPNGIFIGAGPWFHGPHDFHGHVDNHFDIHHGYKGPHPQRGERPEASRRADRNPHFHGNEERDGRGHVINQHH